MPMSPCHEGRRSRDTVHDRHDQQHVSRDGLQVVRGLIESVEAVPHRGEVAAEARVPNALEQQQLHGALVPPQHLLDTPGQAGRLVRAPRQNFSRLVNVHAAPTL